MLYLLDRGSRGRNKRVKKAKLRPGRLWRNVILRRASEKPLALRTLIRHIMIISRFAFTALYIRIYGIHCRKEKRKQDKNYTRTYTGTRTHRQVVARVVRLLCYVLYDIDCERLQASGRVASCSLAGGGFSQAGRPGKRDWNHVRGHHRRLRILAGPLCLIKGARSALLCAPRTSSRAALGTPARGRRPPCHVYSQARSVIFDRHEDRE